MEEQKETQGDKIHPWVYYIGPATADEQGSMAMYFCAFCKDCRQYFTERMALDSAPNFGTFSKSSLPRTGCKGISIGF